MILFTIRKLFFSFMLVAGAASVAAAAAPPKYGDSIPYLHLTSNPPASAYYTTSWHDPHVTPPHVEPESGENPEPEVQEPAYPEQREVESPPPAGPETSRVPGVILTPGGRDLAAPEGWAQFRTTTTVLDILQKPVSFGEPIKLSATIVPSSATGMVQFLVDGSTFREPMPLVDGVAMLQGVCEINPGWHVISADYGGDDTHGMSSSPLQKMFVNKGIQILEFPPLPDVSLGALPFPLAVSATSLLPVSLTSSNSSVATIDNGLVTVVGAGTTVITAIQEGNDYFLPALPISRLLHVSLPSKTRK